MGIVSNVYSGLRYRSFEMNPEGVAELEEILLQATTDRESDSIVGITLLPSALVPTESEGIANVKTVDNTINVYDYFYDPHNDPLKQNVYIPKNAKMFTAPYMFIEIDSTEEKTLYHIEKFQKGIREYFANVWRNDEEGSVGCNFWLSASAGISPTPDIVVRPKFNYDNALGIKNAFVIKGFPQLPYVIDSYRAYIASQGGEFAYSLTQGLKIGGSLLSAYNSFNSYSSENATAGISGLGNLVGSLSQEYVNTHKGDNARGNTNYSIGMIGTRGKNIYVSQVGVNLSDAKKIDNYFTMYGYAVNKIDIPKFNSRPYWNYIKTKQLNVTGEMPNEAIDKIKSIFNNGITWWKDINTMLDYSQDNSPTGN